MELNEWLREAESRLAAVGIDAARIESQLLAAHVLRVDRSWLLAHPDHELNELAAEQLMQRRLAGEPLAYILGWREFYGRTFGVDPSVLIPRHETETLVEAALKLGPPVGHPNGSAALPEARRRFDVLDLGTGSGILAITLKLERPSWAVTASDVSAAALTTASANANFHHAAVRFVLSDRFSALLGESFDLIVSNPPYIGTSEELPAEVAGFEPREALFAGEDGLEFYEALAREAQNHLNDDGRLLVEIGYRQSESVQALFESHGWDAVEKFQDLNGTERVLALRPPF